MSNNLDEILSLTKEITYQDGDDFDITVTEYGEELSKTKDIEFLWIARNTSSTVKKASTNIKSFNDQNIAKNVAEPSAGARLAQIAVQNIAEKNIARAVDPVRPHCFL